VAPPPGREERAGDVAEDGLAAATWDTLAVGEAAGSAEVGVAAADSEADAVPIAELLPLCVRDMLRLGVESALALADMLAVPLWLPVMDAVADAEAPVNSDAVAVVDMLGGAPEPLPVTDAVGV
jgi:hypothetical protein